MRGRTRARGATSTARTSGEALGPSWRARPTAATAIGIAALAGPVGISLAAVSAAGRVVGPPGGPLVLHVGWWAGLSALATVSLVGAGRLSRRLLPLAALLRLSLVFPDSAPSRFRVALRTGTVATLEERLAAARSGAYERTRAEAAALLLELVRHLDEHDPLTRGHSERVRAYAQSIGRELGLGRHELELLNWAALLHDIGKLDVPHETLAKSGRPTDEEWETLRRHPAAGASLAAPLEPWLGEWSAAIHEHHERWDGAGYPQGLAGREISLAGRIVAVADVFDVITSSRSYKRPGSIAEARRELSRCAGTQFDPDVVRAFLAISVRQGRPAAVLAWLAHAAALVRLPATQAAATASAGAAAVVAVSVGMSAEASPPASGVAEPHPAVHAVAAHRPAVRPVARWRPVSTPPAGTKLSPGGRRPRAAHPGDTAPARVSRTAHEPDASSSAPAATPGAPVPAPHTPVASREPSASAAVSASPPQAAAPAPVGPPAGGSPPPPIPPPATPSVATTVGSVTENLADGVASATDDVTAITGDVVSLADPQTPVSEDVSAIASDVSSLTGDVSSLLTPPTPSQQPAPPASPEPEDDAQAQDTSLVDQTVSTVAGLLSKPSP